MAVDFACFSISRFLVYTEKLLLIFKNAAEPAYFLKMTYIKDIFYNKNVL